MITAEKHAIASGHPLATQAGFEVLLAGGNAVDAGVAAGITLGVVHSDLVNFAGVAPIMLRMSHTRQVVTIDGLGVWPEAATAEFFEREFGGAIPEGLLRTVVPAAPAAWITALRDYGTKSFGEVAAAAIRHAREGFRVYSLFARFIADNEDRYRRYAANRAIYLPRGRPPETGELFVQADLASTLQYMVDEEAAAGGSRADGLAAAYGAFYRGDIARGIADYHSQQGGLLTFRDLAAFRVRYEPPLTAAFRNHDFYCCGAWSQGISLAQVLKMLDLIAPTRLRDSGADYVHLVAEILKLVFADREQFVADPAFVNVPVKQMLDLGYLQARLAVVDMERAQPYLEAAESGAGHARLSGPDAGLDILVGRGGEVAPPNAADTSHVCVIDSAGNMFAATPSDTSSDTEVIPGTGLCPSSRGSQSRGISEHINAVAPGKRPRLTPNPALGLKDGKPFLAFGTPGGDVQIQAMVQVVVNLVERRMGLQSAIEAARFATYSFPSSFAPNEVFPNRLMVEDGYGDSVFASLRARGHDVQSWGVQTWKAGGVCAILATAKEGVLHAFADPRRAGNAAGA